MFVILHDSRFQFAAKWDKEQWRNILNQQLTLVSKAYFSCFPLSERLCQMCPLVSVHVRSTLVEWVDHVSLSARSCCQLPALLSLEKLSIHTNGQLQDTSEAIGDSVLCTFMEKAMSNRQPGKVGDNNMLVGLHLG